ncbi:response regulator transcription factor [Salinibius halmophilus]|uniref:response regulator transcription factor n=1 Tax=Salinibius halmophilus TaxID=1853216 RepID=UPI000E66A296|nr:response regulator transcription factor [Salinibius halmophilus]
MIDILIAEDQSLIAGALAALLNMHPKCNVVATCHNGIEALAFVESQPVDIVLTDIEMPEMTGIELAAHLHKHHPNVPVAILTTFARKGYLRRALDAGVKGYLLKDAKSDDLADAIIKIIAGELVIDPGMALQAWQVEDPLTNRERQVLRLAGEGLSNQQISEKIHLSEGTVRNYLSESIQKLGAQNRVDAARIARDQGWL